jgi:hypothetical protein
MGIKIARNQPEESSSSTSSQVLPSLLTPAQAEMMLRTIMRMVSINLTPGLMERFAEGYQDAGVICPECGGDWRAWVEREHRRKDLDLLPWEK